MHRLTVLFLGTALWISGGYSPAIAQHQHGDHEHLAPAEFKPPTSFKEAVGEIDHRMFVIEELMRGKRLAEVHPQAEVIRKVGGMIGRLALRPDSGVPREDVRQVNQTGRDLAAKFDAIDRAADSGDAEGTKKVYDEMAALVDVFFKYVPQVLSCPMKCEGDKSYEKPGDCPKCGMKLTRMREHADHDPKHGGVFFMASDQFHHLEGTLAADGEFRIYFYDNFTRSIPAEKFKVEVGARPKGADRSANKPFTMKLEPGKAFLTGKIDSSLKFPIAVRAFIDFKDGKNPQVFDFEYDEPSKPGEK
jgi:hypothetical protein